jgi:hypothetical protein
MRRSKGGRYWYNLPGWQVNKGEENCMKKPLRDAASGTPARGELLRGMDALWEMMTKDAYEGGEVRVRSTLLLIADGGHAKCCLIDKTENRTAWAAGASFDEAVLALEEALATGAVAWRQDGRVKFPRTR